MKHSMRLILIILLMITAPAALFAQEEPPAAETATAAEVAATAEDTPEEPTATPAAQEEPAPSMYDVRAALLHLLERHPRELLTILRLDPSLLTNEEFLSGYPELAAFVAENPQVTRNPRFYLGQPEPQREESAIGELVESFMIFATFALVALALAWFIRIIIEQKRWTRLSRTQTEVHNKILDRFGTSNELLEYIRTPAGTKFLESAPIPLHADRPVPRSPFTRVVWSIQIGLVIAAAAIGMFLVGLASDGETAEALFALGVIGFFIGAGFVASAVVSIYFSRRFGVWDGAAEAEAAAGDRLNDSGLVR